MDVASPRPIDELQYGICFDQTGRCQFAGLIALIGARDLAAIQDHRQERHAATLDRHLERSMSADHPFRPCRTSAVELWRGWVHRNLASVPFYSRDPVHHAARAGADRQRLQVNFGGQGRVLGKQAEGRLVPGEARPQIAARRRLSFLEQDYPADGGELAWREGRR